MSDWTPLFDLEPLPVTVRVTMSADQRRTARNRDLLAAGVHPATRKRLRPELGTCGDCAHHHAEHHGRNPRIWHKCDQHRLGRSFSAASDIRVSWPACELFVPVGLTDVCASCGAKDIEGNELISDAEGSMFCEDCYQP